MNSSTWKVGLKPVGKYYHAGIVNDVEGILENHKLNTKSCFGTRSSIVIILSIDVTKLCSYQVFYRLTYIFCTYYSNKMVNP